MNIDLDKKDCINCLCFCSLKIEDSLHILLRCHHFNHERFNLMINVKFICHNFECMSDNNKNDVLLCSDSRFHEYKYIYIYIYIYMYIYRGKFAPTNHIKATQTTYFFLYLFVNILMFPWRLRILPSGPIWMFFLTFHFLRT